MFHLLPGGLIDHPTEGIMMVKNWISTRITQSINCRNRLVERIFSELSGNKKHDTSFERLNHQSIQLFEPSQIVLELFPLVFHNKRTGTYIRYEPNDMGLSKMEEDIRQGKIRSGDLLQEDLVFVSKSGDIAQMYIPRCKRHPDSTKMLVKPRDKGQESYYWYCGGCNGGYSGFFYGDLGGENVTKATPVRDPSVFRPRLFSLINVPHDLPNENSELVIFEQAILAKYLGHNESIRDIIQEIRPQGKKDQTNNEDIEELEELAKIISEPVLRKRLLERIQKMKKKNNVGEGLKEELRTIFDIGSDNFYRDNLRNVDSIYEFLHSSKTNERVIDFNIFGSTTLAASKFNDFRERLDRVAVKDLYYSPSIPILTVSYGYTRGSSEDPSELNVRAFSTDSADTESGVPPVYVNQIATEGLILEFDRQVILGWLKQNLNLSIGEKTEESLLKGWFFKNVNLEEINPFKGAEEASLITSTIFKLIHSISHSLIKELATEAGLETASLGERIFPSVPAILIYSNEGSESRIGFLKDVFKNKIRPWIDNSILRTYSCIYDPVCQHQGGACHYCMYLHESSCEYFNKSLDRNMLIGGKEGNIEYSPFWGTISGD